MAQRTADALTDLYEADETAWLEAMAKLIRAKRYRAYRRPLHRRPSCPTCE